MPTQQEIITACFTPLLANPNKGEKGKAPGILVGVTDNGVHSYDKFGHVPMVQSIDTINPTKGYGIFAMANSWGNDDGGTLCNAARKALGELRVSSTKPVKFNTPSCKTLPTCPTLSGEQG